MDQPSPARLSFCILISLYRENSGDDQMSLDVLIRQATLDDIPALLRHAGGCMKTWATTTASSCVR